MRNDFGATFKGFSKGKTGQHAVVEGIIVLLLFSVLLGSMAYQEDTMDERASMRLGPGDSNIDIIQELVPGQEAIFTLTNMDEDYAVEVLIIELENATLAMDKDDGGIVWSQISDQAISVAPGETHRFEAIDTLEFWHLAVVHLNDSADGVVSVQITVEYTGEDLVAKSLWMSLPSLWMTGWVIHRLVRLNMDGRNWIDSTPSHAWKISDESE